MLTKATHSLSRKNLSQFAEIESLSVHYEKDLKESYAISRLVKAQIKIDAIEYATPFVCSSRVRKFYNGKRLISRLFPVVKTWMRLSPDQEVRRKL